MDNTDHLEAETRITQIPDKLRRTGSRDSCLVQLRGPELGKRFELGDTPTSIGRDPSSSIILESDSVSRRHAHLVPFDGGHHLVDNHSTNGTYLNEVLVDGEAVLRSGDYVQVGDAIFKYLQGDNIELAYHEEIYRLTIEDGLTQLPNKRALSDFLDKEFARARRHMRSLAVVMCDLDFFKRVNDEHGHLMGDYVLREVAKLAKARVRREEVFGRYGGEEFCAVLPEISREGALTFAENFRSMVESHIFEFEGNRVPLTISLGVAMLEQSMTRPDALVLAADEKLYLAKHNGRNRVEG